MRKFFAFYKIICLIFQKIFFGKNGNLQYSKNVFNVLKPNFGLLRQKNWFVPKINDILFSAILPRKKKTEKMK